VPLGVGEKEANGENVKESVGGGGRGLGGA